MTPSDSRQSSTAVEPDYIDVGPFDPDELVRWAENYGHPEGWAKKAQSLYGTFATGSRRNPIIGETRSPDGWRTYSHEERQT